MCHSTEIFGILVEPLLQDALGAEAVAPMHDRDLAGEVRQEQRFLDGGIAAADHQDFLAAIEKTVAGGASGYAIAAELLLRRQIEPARLRAGRQDQAVGQIGVAGIADERNGRGAEIDLVHMVGDDFGSDMGGLLLHLLHEPRALDDVGKARIVLDIGRNGELAARLHALDQDRIEHGACGVDRRGIASRAGTDDHKFGVGGIAHRSSVSLGGKRQACPGSRLELADLAL